MNYFFETIAKTENVYLLIDQHFEDGLENAQMKNVVKDILHHKLLDLVLDELSSEQQTTFLIEIEDQENHIGIVGKLREWISDFEDKVQIKVKEVEAEILSLISE